MKIKSQYIQYIYTQNIFKIIKERNRKYQNMWKMFQEILDDCTLIIGSA